MSSDKSVAIVLLKKGWSYSEIYKNLKISKSTLSNWFSSLSDCEKKQIKFHRLKNWRESIKAFQESLKKKTLSLEKEIQLEKSEKIGSLSKRELLLVGSCLYWAEGTKQNRWQLQFSNSDPEMIKIMIKFFREICSVPDSKFYLQLILHKNTNEKEAVNYWSNIIKISQEQFKKACFSLSKSSKKLRPKNRLPYGTLQIRVLDKKIVHEVYGYILGLKKYAQVVHQ